MYNQVELINAAFKNESKRASEGNINVRKLSFIKASNRVADKICDDICSKLNEMRNFRNCHLGLPCIAAVVTATQVRSCVESDVILFDSHGCDAAGAWIVSRFYEMLPGGCGC